MLLCWPGYCSILLTGVLYHFAGRGNFARQGLNNQMVDTHSSVDRGMYYSADRGYSPQDQLTVDRHYPADRGNCAPQGLNKQAVETFLSGQLQQAAQLTQEATVPALLQLARSELPADGDAAEDIRNTWCSLLEQALDGMCARWEGGGGTLGAILGEERRLDDFC